MVETGESNGPRRRPFLATLVLTYGSEMAVAVLSLVNVLIVSRALGPEGRGDVAFLTTIAFLTSNLAAFGVHEANINLAGAEPRLRRTLATNSVLLSALFGGGAVAFLTGLIFVFPPIAAGAENALLVITLAAIPMLILQLYLRLLVHADYGFVLSAAAWTFGPVLNVLVNGLFAAFGTISVGTAIGTWIVGQTVATGMYAWYVARRLAGFGRPDAALARRVLRFGLRSHAGRVMLVGNYRLDQWILGAVAGSRELGLYSVAVAWAEALWYLPTALTAVQRPDVVRASRREAVRQTAAAFRAATLVSVVFAAAMVVAAPFLCVTVFGEEFRGSVDDLRFLTLGVFGVLALKLLGSSLTGQRKPTLASLAIGIGFVATIALDIALIPSFGGAGAALASSLAYTAGGVAVVLIFTRALGGSRAELVPRPSEIPWFLRQARSGLRRRSGPGEHEGGLAEPSDSA